VGGGARGTPPAHNVEKTEEHDMTAPGGKLHATPDQLRTAAGIAQTKADEIDALVSSTNTRVDQMEMTWEGLAPGAFDPLQTKFTADMRLISDRLREMHRMLMDSAQVQDTSDQDSQTALNSVSTTTLNLR
jgi:WXG100 family type VII secretion target